LIDQLSKYLALKFLSQSHPIAVIKKFFYITCSKNTGAAFGILTNQRIFLAAISILIVIFVIYYSTKVSRNETMIHISLSFILGGSFGNLADRLFRGYVVDFFEVKFFSVFNIADIMINIGVLLLLIRLFVIKPAPKS
jgi:signal peptidase II